MRGAAVLAGGVRQRRVPDGRLCSRFFEAGKEGAKGGAARTSKMNALPAGSAILTWLGILRSSTVFEDRGETRRELRQEPVHFVAHLIRGNLPLRNLIDSDFSMGSEVVEGCYGRGGGDSQGFGLVPVRHGSESLGGVLTQVAILSGLTDGHESNPVKRGAWLARKIIAEPPEPPPPIVPELGEKAKGKTLRERLEEHRNREG